MIWKFLKQNVLFPKGLNWVQQWVGRIGLSLLWYIRLRMYWLPKFNMLFQLLLTNFSKSELFCVYKKLITWPIIAKGKKSGGEWKVWVEVCLWGLKTLTFATQPHPQGAFSSFSLAFATMFKTGDHFSWPLFLSFWVGGLARWNYSSNKIVCARHGQSWTPQHALESRPPKPCPVQRHILV